MRVLEFIAGGQTLKRDPLCDFSGIAAGSRGHLVARFRFTKDWAGFKKVAVFVHAGREHPVGLKDNMCEIPADALGGSYVQVYVVGQRGEYRIETGKTAFAQTVRR